MSDLAKGEKFIAIDPVPDFSRYEKEFQKIQAEIAEKLPGAVAVVWFGSTAIPIAGKNILDVMVFIPKGKMNDLSKVACEKMEFEFNPNINELFKSRRYVFLQRKSGEIPVNLHLTSNLVEFFLPLVFVEYLKRHPDVAQKYEEKKREWKNEVLAEKGEGGDEVSIRQAYTAKKTVFVMNVMADAFNHDDAVLRELLVGYIKQDPELLPYYKEHVFFGKLVE